MNIRKLHQIEMTSRCNLRCRYCAHPTMSRPKIDMTEELYTKALVWARKFVFAGYQKELNIAGIGESTIHPDFVRFMHLAREIVGNDVQITLTTNGVAVSDDLVRGIVGMRPTVFVSLHRPERAGPAIEIFKKYGILHGASADPSLAATDWAGQVKWHNSATAQPCVWIAEGKVMAMADGRITRCSLDAHAAGVCGTLDDDLTQIGIAPYSLCAKCIYSAADGLRFQEAT